MSIPTLTPSAPARRGLVRHRLPLVLHRQAALRHGAGRLPAPRARRGDLARVRAVAEHPRGPGIPEIDALARHKGIPRDQVTRMFAQVTDVAADEGLAYDFDRAIAANTFAAHRLVAPRADDGRVGAGGARARGSVLGALRARRRPGRRRDARADRRRGRRRRRGRTGRAGGRRRGGRGPRRRGRGARARRDRRAVLRRRPPHRRLRRPAGRRVHAAARDGVARREPGPDAGDVRRPACVDDSCAI